MLAPMKALLFLVLGYSHIVHRFKKCLLLEGGSATLLETTITRGADIPILLYIMPLIPNYLALTAAVVTTTDTRIIKRICIVWNIYRCDLAYVISERRNFTWGIEHLRDTIPYDQHVLNKAYAANRQYDKMDFTIDNPLRDALYDNWLHKHMGDALFDGLTMSTICINLKEMDSDIIYSYVRNQLN